MTGYIGWLALPIVVPVVVGLIGGYLSTSSSVTGPPGAVLLARTCVLTDG